MPHNPTRPPVAGYIGGLGGLPGGMALGAATFPSDEVYVAAEDDPPPGMPMFETVASDAVVRHFGASYGLLERVRPDVALLARFAHRVEVASIYLCIAFEQAGVDDFVIDLDAGMRRRRGKTWFHWIADTTFCRFQLLRRALQHEWTPPAEAEALVYSAFHSLCDLTPASGHHLKRLYITRKDAAIKSLVSQLELTEQLLEKTVALALQSDEEVHRRVAEEDAERLAATQAEILADAGEVLGLREAARRLGTSHQNLHKRIRSGSALGVMKGRELVVPAFQFVAEGDGWKIMPELKRVLSLFEDSGAGMWSALQFLTDHDPLLGGPPAERLKTGGVDAVVHAARGFLGMDEP